MSSRLYLIAVIAGVSVAQAHAGGNSAGYLISAQDGMPVTAGYGSCVHTLEWTPASSYRQCDPHPVVLEVPAAIEAAPELASSTVVVEEPAEAVVVPASVEAPSPAPFRISLDTLFDFDSAVLRSNAAYTLDELAKQLAGAEYQTVTIVGHADRIGGVKYNQQLSERRAQAVRVYLIARGVDGSKIAAAGVGSTESVTGSTCKGLHGTRLISCLQPDRFAGVTVIGTQTSAMR